MTSSHGNDKKVSALPHHDGSDISQDKKRDNDEKHHHPETHSGPHAPHHVQVHPASGTPRHHPHTKPEEQALNTDHGTHEDRPRPGKIAKKSKR